MKYKSHDDRNNWYKRKFGITAQDFDDMFEKQNKSCAICLTSKSTRFHLDHNHKTKAIRAILCQKCNMTLGMVNEDPTILKECIKYLQRYGA